VALVNAYPRSAPQDAATADLIQHLRSQVIPPAVAGSHLVVYVGGSTAIFSDFSHVLGSKLPVFVGVIVGLSFLLLVVVFRSLVIPVTAAVMNLLSAAAAFGIVTAVFEWGWLGSVFGVNRSGPVEAFLPVMLFSILFGLSTDYEVFLVTRIHEEWLRTGDNREAVRRGLAATGRTITAAAAIMVLVFGSFILGGERVIKEFGLGLAAAILVDAVVIRSVAIPAIMLLIGRANWWFPSWLDRRLPHVSVGPEPEREDEAEPKLVGVGAGPG
jgi:RND superfamily putative drug exporter